MPVGHVEALRHLPRPDIRRRRHPQQAVRHQRQRQLLPLGCAEQDVLDHPRAGVGVNPDMHGYGPALGPSSLEGAALRRVAGSQTAPVLDVVAAAPVFPAHGFLLWDEGRVNCSQARSPGMQPCPPVRRMKSRLPAGRPLHVCNKTTLSGLRNGKNNIFSCRPGRGLDNRPCPLQAHIRAGQLCRAFKNSVKGDLQCKRN